MSLQEKQISQTWHRSEQLLRVLVPSFVLLGFALRVLGLSFVSLDMDEFLLVWYNRLAAGGLAALREPFYNYTPPYMYLLGLVSAQHLLPPVFAIKLISILFDLLNSIMGYKILSLRYPRGVTPLVGAAAFLVLPTVILNSAYWGQADSIYTFFLLVCLYYLMQDRPLPAMVSLGISFSFKAQAVFLAPLILLLILRRKIPWTYLLLVPVVYVLMMLPAAIIGRSLPDLLTVYLSQAGTYGGLSMHAPNPYVFISNDYYKPVLIAGLVIALAAVLAWVILFARRREPLTASSLLFYGLASVGLLPFLLPKMHDRYFYPADVLSFLIAFAYPRLWFLAVGYQILSGLAYSIFLLPSLGPMPRGLPQAILNASGLLSIPLTALLLWNQWKLPDGDDPSTPPTINPKP